jgi:ABC-type branched-subunit amino acid transport system substrate-binding protein
MAFSRRVSGSAGVALIAALAVLAAACGGSSSKSSGGTTSGGAGDSTGVTATTVTIGSHYPLTGPAAPGYSEIGPAAKAYFDFVNSHGGVNGRKIVFKYLDDAYNPAQTVQVVRQLVLQDKVFAIMGGLGTPTHTKVVDFLNQSKVPDLFVASGCLCWDQPTKHPYTFGWQPDYYIEGKILGQYVKDHFAGKKVAYFYQADDFGQDGVRGLDRFIPKADVVSRQSYQPTNVDVGPQVSAIAQAKADVVVSFSIPAFTALLKLTSLKLNYNPQLVVTNVGSDPVTLAALLEAYAKKGGASVQGNQLIQGMISDTYLPPYLGSGASNSWIQLFKKVHDSNASALPFDGNVVYGMAQAYTFVQVLQKAGKQPTRQSLVAAVQAGGLSGPGLVPFRFSKTSHAGYTGVQIFIIQGVPVLQGSPLVTDDSGGAITPFAQPQTMAPPNGIPSG